MAYSRNDSLDSLGSTLTSCSSEASVKFYKERLKPAIDTIMKSQTPLQALVNAAEKIITEQFSPDSRSTYTYKKGSEEISVGLDKVMIAMLTCAEECGGEDGKRYVVSAILACSGEGDVVGALAALGTTWLTHLLFIFKTGKGRGKFDNKKRLLKVVARDGYTCVLTGFQDLSHPKPAEGSFIVSLVSTRVLGWEIGEFNDGHDSESFKSAATTFDILRNFTRLPYRTLEELRDQLSKPSNVVTLEANAWCAFDRFYWCLNRTEKDHVYSLKIFKDGGILRKPENNLVSFQDHSNDFLPDSACNRNPPVDLPDPHFIATHAAIARVLHTSGAGRFFDEVLGKYEDDERNFPAVRCWPELEGLMGKGILRESVFDAFRTFKVGLGGCRSRCNSVDSESDQSIR